MENKKEINTVVEFVKKNPGSSVESIVVGTKLGDIMVRGALKHLMDGNFVKVDADTGTYSIAEKSGKSSAAEKKIETKPDKKKDDDLGPKTVTGRDNSKYRFGEHRNLPKGRLVLALVRAYVEKNPKVSLTKLQEVFQSKEIQPRFGVLDVEKVAKSFSKNNVDRFFLKNDDLIKLANGTKIAVCNQWMPDNIAKILKLAGALGFKVRVEEAAE